MKNLREEYHQSHSFMPAFHANGQSEVTGRKMLGLKN